MSGLALELEPLAQAKESPKTAREARRLLRPLRQA